jgi:hypothetical protein
MGKFILICITLGVLLAMCSDGNNYCDDDTTINPTSAQGIRDMENCAKGWD